MSSGNPSHEKVSEPLHPETASPLQNTAHCGLKAQTQEGEQEHDWKTGQDRWHSHPKRTPEHGELLP